MSIRSAVVFVEELPLQPETQIMDNASQQGLLANTSGEEALDRQLQFLRQSLLKALEAIESIRAAYIPQSDQKQQLREAVQRFEENLLRAALVTSHGNQTHAAQLLGVKVTTFHAKLKRHKIHHDESAAPCPPQS